MPNKEEIKLFTSRNSEEIIRISDAIFDNPEMGFEDRYAGMMP